MEVIFFILKFIVLPVFIGWAAAYLLYSHNERRWLKRLKKLPDTIELKEKVYVRKNEELKQTISRIKKKIFLPSGGGWELDTHYMKLYKKLEGDINLSDLFLLIDWMGYKMVLRKKQND